MRKMEQDVHTLFVKVQRLSQSVSQRGSGRSTVTLCGFSVEMGGVTTVTKDGCEWDAEK